jgi:hypothetical protein
MASLMDFKSISTRYDFVGNNNFLADGSKVSGFWVAVNRSENIDSNLGTGYKLMDATTGDYTSSNINFTGGGVLNDRGYDVFAGQLVQQNIFIDKDRDGVFDAGDQRFIYGFGAADTVDTLNDYAYSSSQFTSSRAYNFAVTSTVYTDVPPDGNMSVNSLTLDWTDRITSKALLSAKLNAGATIDEGVVYPEFSQTYSDPSMMDPTVTTSTVSFAKGSTLQATASTIVCFAKGSLIAAQSGSVAVEKLKVGDKVLTVTGQYETIKWVGHRRVNCNKHSRPTEAWPVRVSKDAFGAGMPNQDLYLSPAHSVYVYGHLVPIIHLVNDVTIVQEERPTVIYYHIELDHHSVIYAQGLPSETFLDSTNRKFFMTASSNVTTLADADEEFSELAGREKYLANCFAPFVTEGPVLEAIYEKLVGKVKLLAKAA